MASAPEGAIGVGLGYATALLQLHLGLGLALAGLGAAVASRGRLAKALSDVQWEETLRAAASSAGQVPLLAAFALIQARGAATDALSWVGLLVSSMSVLMGTFLVIASPICGWEAGDAEGDDEDEGPAANRLSMARRVVSSVGAIGEAILLFGAVPSGVQLLIASLLLRMALAIHALGAAGRALALNGGDDFLAAYADAEVVMPLASLVAALAMLDHIAWGPGSLLMAPLQPVLYCTVACIVKVSLILAARYGPDSSYYHEEDCAHWTLSRATGAGLCIALAAAVGRVFAGTFAIEASLDRLAVSWGEPLFAAAALLAAIIVAIHVAELLLARLAQAAPAPNGAAAVNGHSNGHADPDATEDSIQEPSLEAPTTMENLKAIVAPAISLVLALAAVHMSLPGAPTAGGASAVSLLASMMVAPFRYGLLGASAAVALQVLTLVVFTALRSDGSPAAMLDATGTLQLQPESELARGLAARLRGATHALLVGGLLLGFLGMGALPVLLAGPVLQALLYLLASPGARAKASVVTQAFAALAGSSIEERRLAWEAASAQKAALRAAALEAEIAAGGSAGEVKMNGGKPVAKAAGKAASWKAPKSLDKKGPKKKHA